MSPWLPRSDAVHWYMQELSARVVAHSGIPGDRHHLGKLILQSFKDAPDFVLQIDGSTDEMETFGSALKRSVQCANSYKKLGLKHGDVIVIMAPTHIHLSIPMYAAFYLGIAVAGIDMTLGVNELKETFKYTLPKMIFCQSDKIKDVQSVLNELNLNTHVVTFDKSDKSLHFSQLLDQYGTEVSVDDFKATDFDPADTMSLLIATSGSTGLPKSAVVTHKNMAVSVPYMWITYNKFPTPTRLSVIFSPIQWYSALFQILFSPLLRHTRLQSSAPMTQEHAYYLINKYKPTYTMISPNVLATYLKNGDQNICDFSCFETIFISGSFVHPSIVEEMQVICPHTKIMVLYGMSEICGPAFNFDGTQISSLGKPLQSLEHKLVNPETFNEITELNIPGELWLRGPGVFKGYYNNPESTALVLMKDGWFRTGDILYKNEKSDFYYVDRMKLLLKYRNHHISPLEIESVIAKHPGVFAVAVAGIPHAEHGDLPVACVVAVENYNITAKEIKELVKDSLNDTKQLRGGVIFLKELPLTSTLKIDRRKLASIVLTMDRE